MVFFIPLDFSAPAFPRPHSAVGSTDQRMLPNHGKQGVAASGRRGAQAESCCLLPSLGASWASEYPAAPFPSPLLGFRHQGDGPEPQVPISTPAPLNHTPVVWGHLPRPCQQLFHLLLPMAGMQMWWCATP